MYHRVYCDTAPTMCAALLSPSVRTDSLFRLDGRTRRVPNSATENPSKQCIIIPGMYPAVFCRVLLQFHHDATVHYSSLVVLHVVTLSGSRVAFVVMREE